MMKMGGVAAAAATSTTCATLTSPVGPIVVVTQAEG
eukprot:CAMPEP_0194040758 /NCGR_PEP_ID=MMETSP0009_2-20130614/12715_1 /TAXON_ID=210454 /ORGANISM="Grammatophora oceanica, Strain CCMP 410" /LENGTH=35 /DNA_ID= /DNA_START= /DNA_END= /DNA_ORIENTATION=